MPKQRRGKQEGSFYQRKDGNWCAQMMIDNRRYTAYGKTKTEAKNKLKAKVSFEQSKSGDNPHVKFCDYSQYMFDYKLRNGFIKRSTYQSLSSYLSNIKPYLDGLYLDEINKEEVVRIVSAMNLNGYKQSTVFTMVSNIILATINFANEQGYNLPHISGKMVFSSSCKQNTLQSFDVDLTKLKQQIDKVKNEKVRMCIKIMLYTGLRLGEVVCLKLPDINLADGIIFVNRTAYKLCSGEVILQAPKSNRVGEYVQIPSIFLSEFKQYCKEHKSNNEFLFYDEKAQRIIQMPIVSYHCKKIASYFGVNNMRAHFFRHLHASILASNNVDVVTIQHQLRHSSIAMTNKYLQRIGKETRDNIKRLTF